jgi:Apea-like HEPN
MQHNVIMRAEFYPVEVIDALFAAIRISTGFSTGYAQMLTLPVGWASSFTADLVSAEGPRVESHPSFFDFDDEVPTVTSGEASGIRKTFEDMQRALSTRHAGKVRLAIQRLKLSTLRTTTEDGVIDAMIAMEALLSDGAQEMTHKVAMRLAALYKILNSSRSEQAFEELKKVYKVRSMIVHGEANLDKHREIDRGGEKIPADDVAVEHLLNAFSVLIKHPSLLDPKQIDIFLLTGTC